MARGSIGSASPTVYSSPWTTLEAHGGGINSTAAQNLAAFNSAVTALKAANSTEKGTILIGPGEYTFSDTLTAPYQLTSEASSSRTSIAIRGMGAGKSVLTRAFDGVLIEASGLHPSTSTTARCTRFEMSDLTLNGGGSSYTQPLVRAYYSEKQKYHNVEFRDFYGIGLDMVECWDNWFKWCFFSNGGGRDAASPMVYIRTQTNSSGGFGHSTASPNMIWFDNCRFEAWRDGAIWMEGTSSVFPYENRITNCKFENNTTDGGMRGNSLKFSRTNYTYMFKCDVVCCARDATTTPSATDVVYVGGGRSNTLQNVIFRTVSGMSTTEVNSFVKLDGSIGGGNISPGLLDVHFILDSAGRYPVTACVVAAGTNSSCRIRGTQATVNTPAATLLSGTVTSMFTEPTWT